MAVTSMRAGNNAGYGPVKDEQAFRKELMTRTSAVTSIQTKFIQEKFLSVFSRIVKSEGRFYWQKPNSICLDYQTPAKYRITIAGDRIKTVSNGKANVISAKGNPMMDQMSSLIAACMTGNLSAMGSGFKTVVLESNYHNASEPDCQELYLQNGNLPRQEGLVGEQACHVRECYGLYRICFL